MKRSIHKDEYTLPSDTEVEDVEGQEGFLILRQIPVPQSLRKCVQTVDCLGIEVRHSLTFNIQLHNPDGHVSEASLFHQSFPLAKLIDEKLHATLAVCIFLSPNLPVDENDNLVNQSTRGAITANGISEFTPPHNTASIWWELVPGANNAYRELDCRSVEIMRVMTRWFSSRSTL